jgi:hypothetical protein
MSVPMEGSMRTMSWSRYHYLCWSSVRIRIRLRSKRTAIRRLGDSRANQGAPTDRPAPPDVEIASAHTLLRAHNN